jgi:hypothetical protein
MCFILSDLKCYGSIKCLCKTACLSRKTKSKKMDWENATNFAVLFAGCLQAQSLREYSRHIKGSI